VAVTAVSHVGAADGIYQVVSPLAVVGRTVVTALVAPISLGNQAHVVTVVCRNEHLRKVVAVSAVGSKGCGDVNPTGIVVDHIKYPWRGVPEGRGILVILSSWNMALGACLWLEIASGMTRRLAAITVTYPTGLAVVIFVGCRILHLTMDAEVEGTRVDVGIAARINTMATHAVRTTRAVVHIVRELVHLVALRDGGTMATLADVIGVATLGKSRIVVQPGPISANPGIAVVPVG
jgi:hypothetical protein